MADDVETFDAAGAGSSLTQPVQAGSLRKGDYVCLRDHPCKIVEISTSKTGKHGHAKANIVGLHVFTGKKYEDIAPTSHALPSPIVERKEYQLLDVSKEGNMSLMDDKGTVRDDLDLPEDQDVSRPLAAAYASGRVLLVVVLSAMGKEAVISFRDEPKG